VQESAGGGFVRLGHASESNAVRAAVGDFGRSALNLTDSYDATKGDIMTKYDGHRLEGKTALVTGASRGIGTAIARRLAAEGAQVACVARTLDPDPKYTGTLRDTIDLIEKAGGRAKAFKCDLSNSDDRKRMVDEVHNECGPVDILVNNAAVTFFLPIDTFPEKRFKLMIETQVWASIDLAQQVIPDMRSRGAGWILNISSRAAVKPMGPPFEDFYKTGNSSVYGLCKAALERLSLGMAAERSRSTASNPRRSSPKRPRTVLRRTATAHRSRRLQPEPHPGTRRDSARDHGRAHRHVARGPLRHRTPCRRSVVAPGPTGPATSRPRRRRCISPAIRRR